MDLKPKKPPRDPPARVSAGRKLRFDGPHARIPRPIYHTPGKDRPDGEESAR